ncbi:MAG: hypothetical protein HEQ23_15865 [Tepidisphaera sp.]
MIPRAISGDGRVVVGYASQKTMVWVIDEGIEVCTSPVVAFGSTGSGISYDGSIVGGVASASPQQSGFRWDRSTGTASLLQDATGARLLSVSAVSNDGQTIVGDVRGGGRNAAYWTQSSGVVVVNGPNGLDTIFMAEVSSDGQNMVGVMDGAAPFAWNAQQGSFVVPLPSGLTSAFNLCLTANGDAIFGQAFIPTPGSGQAFTWNPDTGASAIPLFDGYDLTLFGANADGRVLVGRARPLDPSGASVAFVRTLGLETILLGDYLALYGSTYANSDFQRAFDVSDDGNVILGSGGIHPHWVAILPPPSLSDFNVNNFVDFTDMMDFLDCFEGRSSLPVSSADLNKDGMTDFFDLIEFIDNF